MSPLEAALLVAALVLPLHWLLQRELAKLEDAEWLRQQGVVIVKPRALQHSAAIGTYRDQEIWATVTFKGLRYRFHRVVPAAWRERTGPGELYLEPGLVYLID